MTNSGEHDALLKITVIIYLHLIISEAYNSYGTSNLSNDLRSSQLPQTNRWNTHAPSIHIVMIRMLRLHNVQTETRDYSK